MVCRIREQTQSLEDRWQICGNLALLPTWSNVIWKFYLPGASRWLTSILGPNGLLLGPLEIVVLTSKSIIKPTRKSWVLISSGNPEGELQFAEGLEAIFIFSVYQLELTSPKAFPFVYILGKSFHCRINYKTFSINSSVFFQIGGEVESDEDWERQGWLEWYK